MKTNTLNQNSLIEDVKNLINFSVNNMDASESKFKQFHQEIVEKYFVAKNVQINYVEQTIDLQLFMSNEKYTNLTFECLDLIGFLQSCIKCDSDSLVYYETLMTEYDTVVAA